ncbi:MAG: DnaJ domain-containing protein [Chloroflexi bacterium]|nr:DnaJ domain-containing protein [Chloroflexota bacterium]
MLQVSPWCEPEVITAAYRALARSRHPDVNRGPDAEEEMRRLNAAYHVLSDPLQRARYDEECALMLVPAVAARPAPPASQAPRPAPAATARPAPDFGPDSDVAPSSRPSARPRRSPVMPGAARSVPFTDSVRLDGRLDSPLPGPILYVTLILVAVVFSLALWLLVDVIQGQRIFRGSFLDDGASSAPSVVTRPAYGGSDEGRFSPPLLPAAQPGLPERRERWTR